MLVSSNHVLALHKVFTSQVKVDGGKTNIKSDPPRLAHVTPLSKESKKESEKEEKARKRRRRRT